MKQYTWTEALAIRCRRCHARPKQKCVSLETGKPKRWPHPQRVQDHQQTKDRHDHSGQPAGQRL